MIDLWYGDLCPESLLPIFGREVCATENGSRACLLADGHDCWHAELDAVGRVVTSWRPREETVDGHRG